MTNEVQKGDIVYFCGHQMFVMKIEGDTATVLFDGDDEIQMTVQKLQGFKDNDRRTP